MPTNVPHGAARVSLVQAGRRGRLAQGILALAVLAILALGLCDLIGIRDAIAPEVPDRRLPQPRSNQYHGEYNPAEIFRPYAR
jgi:hypothetical protein